MFLFCSLGQSYLLERMVKDFFKKEDIDVMNENGTRVIHYC